MWIQMLFFHDTICYVSVELQPWKSIRGLGTWRMLTSEQLYFVPGHQHLAWWSDSRYMKPDTIVSYLYHLSCFCWITTLLNRVVVKAHGGCCCPGNYFVPVYQHLAWWLYPRHINQILSFYIYIYLYIYMLYLCWITILWNRVVVKAHGGCCCPGNYFVPVYQHLAWWLYPRHINQILSFYIDIYIGYISAELQPCGIESWLRHMADVVVLVTILSRYISTCHDDYIRDI